MKNLRWHKGKELVSFLRNGDYAHAGGADSISMVMSKFTKEKNQLILDVGCGRGGSADFIQKQGWGSVTGIDIETSAIEYAKSKYPDVSFLVSDVFESGEILHSTFDIICLFNSLYAFNNQLEALKILRTLAKEHAKIAICEYTDLCYPRKNPFMDKKNKKAVSIPVNKNKLIGMFKKSGWDFLEFVDLNDEYEKWYLKLLNSIKANKDIIFERFGEEMYQRSYDRYRQIYDYISQGFIGGGIFYAKVTN